MKVGMKPRYTLAPLLLALALALLPAATSAQTAQPSATSLSLAAPQEAPLGEEVSLVAVLKDSAGRPIQGARILFTTPVTFGGTTGEMAIGEALTEGTGAATLNYQLTVQGPNRFIARFYGDGSNQPSEASADTRSTGLVQITRRTAGIQVPVLGWWTIVAVLWGVWTVYFIGMLQILSIAESGSRHPSPDPGGQPRLDMGGRP